MKSLFQKLFASADAPEPDGGAAAAPEPRQPQRAARRQAPGELQMPEALLAELFPERGAMVSVIFNDAKPKSVPEPPAPVAKAAPPKPVPAAKGAIGRIENPEWLALPDDLREAIFPQQKLMVSVVFNVDGGPSPSPEPATHGDEKDFPII